MIFLTPCPTYSLSQSVLDYLGPLLLPPLRVELFELFDLLVFVVLLVAVDWLDCVVLLDCVVPLDCVVLLDCIVLLDCGVTVKDSSSSVAQEVALLAQVMRLPASFAARKPFATAAFTPVVTHST